MAGLPFRIVFLLLGFAGGAATVAYFSLSHVRSRVDRFLNPESGDTFQIEKIIRGLLRVVGFLEWVRGRGR